MNRFILFILSLFLITVAVSAQVNTERLRRKINDTGFYSGFTLSLDMKQGNTEYYDIGTGVRLDYYQKSFHLFLAGNFQYKESREIKNANNGFIHIRYVRTLNGWLKIEGFIQTEFDNFKRINSRELLGAGARIKLMDQYGIDSVYDADITFGTGFMAEYENQNISGSSAEVSRLRSTSYLSAIFNVTKTLSLNGVAYFQPDLADLSVYRILTEAGLNIKASEVFSLQTKVNYLFDSSPLPGIKNYDLRFSTGVSINF